MRLRQSKYTKSPARTATGERIGTAIKAAIGITLPGVQDIINAIWPDRNQKKKGSDNSVTVALNTQQNNIKNEVLKHLKNVNAVVAELKILELL